MLVRRLSRFLVFFFFNDTATTEIYTLSLHDAFRSPDLVGQAWKGKYRGQTQKWYALRFTGDEREIDVATPGGGAHAPEFVEWRWEPMQNLPELVVPFKRATYERVVSEFSRFARAR